MRLRRVLFAVTLVAVPATVLFVCLRHVETEVPTHVKFVDVEGWRAARRLARDLGWISGKPQPAPGGVSPRERAVRAEKRATPPAVPEPIDPFRGLVPQEDELAIEEVTLADGTTVYRIRQGSLRKK